MNKGIAIAICSLYIANSYEFKISVKNYWIPIKIFIRKVGNINVCWWKAKACFKLLIYLFYFYFLVPDSCAQCCFLNSVRMRTGVGLHKNMLALVYFIFLASCMVTLIQHLFKLIPYFKYLLKLLLCFSLFSYVFHF